MAYNITLSNGQNLTTIQDGTLDTTSTSLTLVGRNVAEYGGLVDSNLVHMIENFSNGVAPLNPLIGQLWWNSSINSLQVYNGTLWRNVAPLTSSSTAPQYPQIGDQWWDTINEQLKTYVGNQWITVGPQYTKSEGITGAFADVVTDIYNGVHIVLKFFVGGTLLAICSSDQTYETNSLLYFSNIYPGINLTTEVFGANATVLNGTVTNSLNLNNTANYLRSDISQTINGNFTVSENFVANGASTFSTANCNILNVNDINSKFLFLVNGTINAAIGETTPNVGIFTSLSSSSGITGTLLTANQPNITNVGTLLQLNVSGSSTGYVDNVIIGSKIPQNGEFTNGSFSGQLNITNQTPSNSTITGALIVSGGVGINQSLNVAGGVTAPSAYFNNLSVSGTADVATLQISGSSTISQNLQVDGSIVVNGSTSIGTNLSVSGSFNSTGSITTTSTGNFNNLNVTNTINTGSLSVSGSSTFGSLILNGSFNSTGSITTTSTGNFNNLNVSNAINTGSLVASGTISATGDLHVGGSLYVTGTTTTVNSNTISTTDLTINLAQGATQSSANGSGIIINGANASILYNSSNDVLIINKGVIAPSFSGSSLNITGTGTFGAVNASTFGGGSFSGSSLNITGTASVGSLTVGGTTLNTYISNVASASLTTVNTTNTLAYQGVVAPNNGTGLVQGLQVEGVYSNGYPAEYGNLLTVYGGGAGQFLIGWSGVTGALADNYIRSLKDTAIGSNSWSPWAKIYTDQNISSATINGSQVTGTVPSANTANTATTASVANSLNTLNSYTVGQLNASQLLVPGTGNFGSITTGGSITFNGSLISSAAITLGNNTFVQGALDVTGDVTAFYSSDIKLKKDIRKIDNALEKVNKISGVTFSWNDVNKGKDRESGVIAQEILQVIPEVVKERDNGTLAVAYEKLVPLLIEAIKELSLEVDKLKNK